MKKNVFFLSLALVIIISLVLVGCSSTPSSTPAPSIGVATPPLSTTAQVVSTATPSTTYTASSSTSSPAAKIITLKYADQNPSSGWEGVHAAQPWIDAITKATNGQVQLQAYWAQSLFKGGDAWASVQNDVADISWMGMGSWANLTPLSTVINLPFLPFKSATQASGIYWQLLQKYPSIAAEYKPNTPLVAFTTTPYFLITIKKQVKTLADWKGLKIRALAGPQVDMVKALGAVPINVGMPDTYLDLQKGVLDGMLDCWEAMLSWKHYEVVKYYTYFSGGPVALESVTMNSAKWNSLPPDVQKEMESVIGLQGSLFWGYNQFDTSAATGPGIVQKAGYSMVNYTVPQAEIDKWSAIAGKPLWDAWVKQMTAKGHPEAQDILNTTLDLIQTYNPPPASQLSSNTY